MTTRIKSDEHEAPVLADDVTTLTGPVTAASEAIAEARRVRAEEADELAAWMAIPNRAA